MRASLKVLSLDATALEAYPTPAGGSSVGHARLHQRRDGTGLMPVSVPLSVTS